MTNKTILYIGLAVLIMSLLAFIGCLIYVFAPLFAQESAGIGAITLTYTFLPIFGVFFGIILTIIGFFKSKNRKDVS